MSAKSMIPYIKIKIFIDNKVTNKATRQENTIKKSKNSETTFDKKIKIW